MQAIQSEVLWRIKDAEELIKQRVSAQRVDFLIRELEGKVNKRYADHKNDLTDKYDEWLQKVESEHKKEKTFNK